MSIPVELTNRRMETERYSSVKAGRRRLPSELIREVVKFVDTEKWPKKMCRISAVLDSYVRERYWKKVLNTITVETNAQEKLVEAEKTGNTPTEAINLYVQAAEAFKLADNWFKAGETFVKIAKLFELQGNERGYIDNTAEAAECFLKVKKETNSITETDEPGNSGIAQQQIRNSKKTDEQGNSGIVQHGNSKTINLSQCRACSIYFAHPDKDKNFSGPTFHKNDCLYMARAKELKKEDFFIDNAITVPIGDLGQMEKMGQIKDLNAKAMKFHKLKKTTIYEPDCS